MDGGGGGRRQGTARCQNETVPERGKSQITYTEFEIFDPNVFFKNTSKNKFPTGYGDSGTQNGTVPEEAKIHLSLGLFVNFIEHVFFQKYFKKYLSYRIRRFRRPKWDGPGGG